MIHYKIFTSVSQLPITWDKLDSDNILLKIPYFKALENASPENISSYFVGVFNDEVLIGKALFQLVKFNLDAENKSKNDFLSKLIQQSIRRIAKGNLLVFGNFMHTGQHAYFFKEDEVSNDAFFNQVNLALEAIQTNFHKQKNKKIKVILLKDFFKQDEIHKSSLISDKNHFFEVQVQPNMVLNLSHTWESIEDYTLSLTKKYRSRYKTALKKKHIIVKDLSIHDIQLNEKELFKLYKNVSNNASINSFNLPNNHFLELKKQLKDDFKVFGYFLNEELIGFFTLINNNEVLETYFLGYNSTLNHKHQLYLNMLYDMIAYGISNKFKKIVFARTALEIKSSIGAKPVPMVMYMKHTKPILNTILKLSTNFMSSDPKWEERHPFKG